MVYHIVSSEPASPQRGNRLDQAGTRKHVLQVWQTAAIGPSKRQVEYMQFGRNGLRPLVFLHSLEYPKAPRWGFCVDAVEAGFGTFAIRRPGFGASDVVKGLEEQAALIVQFLDEADLDNVVLVSTGSGCPVGYRVALASSRVTYSVYVTCVFNRDVFGEFHPDWLSSMLRQALWNSAGARLTLGALRQAAATRGVDWFYKTLMQKSVGDLDFIRAYSADMEDAWSVCSRIDSSVFREDIRSTLRDDALLTDGALAHLRGIALSGLETSEVWRAGFEMEAKRLGLPTAYLSSGELLAAYQSGQELLSLIRERA
jgi:pimeloyl-ACP methyl ester carboxylesterase